MIDQLTLNRPGAEGEGPGARVDQRSRQHVGVLAIMAVVVAADQGAKWWAWRHLGDAVINPGGTGFLGSTFGSFFSGPASGALLDLLDSSLLGVLVSVLVRHPRSRVVLGSAAVMFGGWSSNLLDRLGMHDVTAPDSLRGAVDFLPLGGYCYNLADVFIATGTVVFLTATSRVLLRQFDHGPVTRFLSAADRCVPALLRRFRPLRRRRAATAVGSAALAVAVLVAVVVGATHDRGLESPGLAASASPPPAGTPG